MTAAIVSAVVVAMPTLTADVGRKDGEDGGEKKWQEKTAARRNQQNRYATRKR